MFLTNRCIMQTVISIYNRDYFPTSTQNVDAISLLYQAKHLSTYFVEENLIHNSN